MSVPWWPWFGSCELDVPWPEMRRSASNIQFKWITTFCDGVLRCCLSHRSKADALLSIGAKTQHLRTSSKKFGSNHVGASIRSGTHNPSKSRWYQKRFENPHVNYGNGPWSLMSGSSYRGILRSQKWWDFRFDMAQRGDVLRRWVLLRWGSQLSIHVRIGVWARHHAQLGKH